VADLAMKEYLDANKKATTFQEKLNNVKVHLRDNKGTLPVEQLIQTAELNAESYKAIQSINTLDEYVNEFNEIFNINI